MLFFLLNIQAQNVALYLYFQDNVGNRDTVVFGLNDEAIVGIDPELREKNIFGESIENLDARVIHRDSSHFNCHRESMSQFPDPPNLYFPENMDLKTDFRPFGLFKSINNNFEIFVRAMEYPVTIKADFTEIRGTFLEGYSTIYLLDENCDVYEDKSILYKPICDTGLRDLIPPVSNHKSLKFTITHHYLSTLHCQLPTAHCRLPTANCRLTLLIALCPLPHKTSSSPRMPFSSDRLS